MNKINPIKDTIIYFIGSLIISAIFYGGLKDTNYFIGYLFVCFFGVVIGTIIVYIVKSNQFALDKENAQ